MTGFFFWTGFALTCGSVLCLKRKIELVKCAVLGTIYYFMFYVVASGLLFLCGQFSIKRATFLLFVLWGILFAMIAVKKRKREPLCLLPLEKQSWLSYLIIAILLVVFSGSFGYFGMGQDQGVYQVEAINFANGRNEWLTTFPEYDQLTDGEYKNFYREAVDAIPGVEMVDVEYGFRESFRIPRLGELDVIYHGIPTYPAILGLGVKLFGMEHMMLFQAVFYIVLLFLVEIMLREHRVHWLMRAILVTVLGVSPEIIWMRKSTLTEMFLAVLMTYYLYKILDEDDRQKSLSVLAIIVFSFFHASAFSILPVFVINFWILYLVKKDIRFLRNAAEALAGFCVGFVMMFRVEPIYMSKNFMRLMEQNGVAFPYHLVPVMMLLLTVGVAGLGFLLPRVWKDKNEAVLKAGRIVLGVVSAICIFDFISGRSWWGGFFTPGVWSSDFHLLGVSTFMAYLQLTGFFLLPMVLFRLIIGIKKSYDNRLFLVALFLLWTVEIYSMVLRLRVMSYYYNARYLVPFFSGIILLYGLLFGQGGDTNTLRYRILRGVGMILPILGICFMLPFSNVMCQNQDDTNMQWSTLSDMMNHVKEGDIVFIDQNEMWYFFYPMRSKGALVYPVMGDFETTMEKAEIDSNSTNLYYITENRSYEDDWRYEVVYESKSKYQLDDQMHYVEYLRLPTEFAQKGERSHVLYHWMTPETQINAADDNFGKGWSVTNAAGYRWMCNKEASLGAYLTKGDYQMRIQQGDSIPFGLISTDEVKTDVFINGHELESLTFSGETNGIQLTLEIPKEYVVEGSNKITFVTGDLWSPKEYGEADQSQYAFSVGNIWFDQIE